MDTSTISIIAMIKNVGFFILTMVSPINSVIDSLEAELHIFELDKVI